MPRQVLRRGPAAPPPSTPSTAAFQQQQQQPPPVPVPVPVPANATTTPVFATPPGFPQDVELFPSGNPAWQRQQQRPQRLNNQPTRPEFDAVTTAATMSELGEDTDVENDRIEGERMDSDLRAIDFDAIMEGEDDDEEVDEELDEEEVEGDDENEEMRERRKSPSPLPPDLREISSLASWTVSTHKPGCGVAALRNASPQQFWQSDGPQPHTLTLHFFKLVAIVKIRVYLDFDLDESYTPTKMLFYAGMGGNDLVEFASWEGESPAGWVNIPLEGVGGRNRKRDYGIEKSRRQTQRPWPSKSVLPNGSGIEENGNDLDDEEDDREIDVNDDYDDFDDPYLGNVLKAMVVQVRICENHQNGKDTHVRGFQVFAHDDDRRRVAAAAAAAATAGQPGHKRESIRKSLQNHSHDGLGSVGEGLADKIHGLDEPDWMGEPVIR